MGAVALNSVVFVSPVVVDHQQPMGTVAVLSPGYIGACGGDAVDADIAAVNAVLLANRSVETVLPAALGYGAVDIVVADIIVVPLIVVQGGEGGMGSGTRVDVDNAVPAFPIVDIPNGCIGSVGPIDLG